MLQEIVRNMYIEPEILAALDDEQKQTLFCKIREEQVRRWKLWNDKLTEKENEITSTDCGSKTSLNGKKSVSFLKGSNGEPWVWVMGEHKDDKSIEQILREEAIEKARRIAEEETVELRKQMEAQLYFDLHPKIDVEDDYKSQQVVDEDIYCCVDEIKQVPRKQILNIVNNKTNSNLNETHKLTTQKVSHRIAMWEKKVTQERTCEIYNTICKKRQEIDKRAKEDAKKQEQLWLEQERKAKEADKKIRQIARKAREEYRSLDSQFELELPVAHGTSIMRYKKDSDKDNVPVDRKAVLDWYKTKEKPRKAGFSTGDDSSNGTSEKLELWFHGMITRTEAEKVLLDQPYGTFLVRLSEKIWGYTISYRAKEKCKHYMISANEKYQFLGTNQMQHSTLNDLVNYHRKNPLTGGDKLLQPCLRNWNESVDQLLLKN